MQPKGNLKHLAWAHNHNGHKNYESQQIRQDAVLIIYNNNKNWMTV